ncbi:MAG: hypothetical protein V4449_01775 [Patescibacteria group bacterium]
MAFEKEKLAAGAVGVAGVGAILESLGLNIGAGVAVELLKKLVGF